MQHVSLLNNFLFFFKGAYLVSLLLTNVWRPRCAWSKTGVETVEDRAIEGGRRPRSTHVRAQVGRMRSVVRPAEALGACTRLQSCLAGYEAAVSWAVATAERKEAGW